MKIDPMACVPQTHTPFYIEAPKFGCALFMPTNDTTIGYL